MKRLVGFPLLDHIDTDDACHEDEHNRAVSGLAKNKIDNGSGNEQQKHRLAENMKCFLEKGFLLLWRQLVFTV